MFANRATSTPRFTVALPVGLTLLPLACASAASPSSAAPAPAVPAVAQAAPSSGAPRESPPVGSKLAVPSKASAGGGTTLTGVLEGELTAEGSPYRIVGDANQVATIPRGKTLKVGPGVVLDFVGNPAVTAADTQGDEVMHHQKGRVELRVYGRIVIQGTADRKVTLTSSNPHGWWGINFFGDESVGTGHPIFDHMIFEKVRKNDYNGTRQFTRGAIWAFYPARPVTLTNSILRDNVSAAKCGAIDLMYTQGSRVENNLFENNRTSEIDRFAQEGSASMSGGGAMCITHGRDSIVRNNIFRNNRLESFRGLSRSRLTPRGFLVWPNPQNTRDLGGGGALHYIQPVNDLIEGNLFEGNVAAQGPGAAIYLEDVPERGVTLKGNRFLNNQGGAGGVIVCNRGGGSPQLVVAPDNQFSGNTVKGAQAPEVTGDCRR